MESHLEARIWNDAFNLVQDELGIPRGSGKAPPGGGFPGTHYYQTFTFTNTSGAPRCYTVTINTGQPSQGDGDIESVAYDQAYDPTMLDKNYLGDSGISGLGTTVDHASYSFTVPASITWWWS